MSALGGSLCNRHGVSVKYLIPSVPAGQRVDKVIGSGLIIQHPVNKAAQLLDYATVII